MVIEVSEKTFKFVDKVFLPSLVYVGAPSASILSAWGAFAFQNKYLYGACCILLLMSFVVMLFSGGFLYIAALAGIAGYIGGIYNNPYQEWYYVLAGISAIIGLKNFVSGSAGSSTGVRREVTKGSQITSIESLRAELNKECQIEGDGLAIVLSREGGVVLSLPMQRVRSHCFIAGKTGTGKSSILLPILTQIENRRRNGKKIVTIALDVKGDITSMYMSGREDVFLMSPADQRSIAFAVDIESSTDAEYIASVCIPQSRQSDPFWTDTARQVLAAVFLGCKVQNSLAGKPNPNFIEWNTVYDNLIDKQRLNKILSLTDKGSLVSMHLQEPRTTNNILSVLVQNIEFISEIKKAWAQADFNIREFVKSGTGLVICRYHEKYPVLSAKMIGIFLEQVFCEILTQPDGGATEYYLILDELMNLPSLKGLSRILSLGRSKKCAVFYTFQTRAGLEKVYGKENTHTITEQPSTAVFLQCSGETAKWASETLGDQEILQTSTSSTAGSSNGPGGGSSNSGTSTSQQILTGKTVLAGEISGFPTPNPSNPIATGMLHVSGHGAVRVEWPCGLQPPQQYPAEIRAAWTTESPARAGLDLSGGTPQAQGLGTPGQPQEAASTNQPSVRPGGRDRGLDPLDF